MAGAPPFGRVLRLEGEIAVGGIRQEGILADEGIGFGRGEVGCSLGFPLGWWPLMNSGTGSLALATTAF